MKSWSILLISLSSLTFLRCGILQKDDDSSSNGPGSAAPNFELTGVEFSEVRPADVTQFVNRTQLIRAFKFNSLDLAARVITISGGISRGKNASFATCIKSKIENTKLEATLDSVGYSINFDFIALCDAASEPDDLISDVRNNLVATMKIGCAGGKTETKDGQTIKEMDVNICTGAQSATYTYNFTINAHSATKVKKGTEYVITAVRDIVLNESVAAPNGTPCNLVIENDKFSRLPGCRLLTQSKTYSGDPKFEANSPKSSKAGIDPHPIVVQAAVTIENAQIDGTAP